MSVPVGRRSESKFEAQHHFFQLRDEVSKLILNDFGYSEHKYLADMEKYRQAHLSAPNVDDVVERWKCKNESFKRWFIDEEGKAILDIMRNIQMEFTIANSIFPSQTHAKLLEFLTRRYHMNRAIGLCYALKQEIQYVIRILPVDVNKYERFAIEIDKQILLYKGVRKADNRLIKPVNTNNSTTLSDNVARVCDGLINIIRKVSKIDQEAK